MSKIIEDCEVLTNEEILMTEFNELYLDKVFESYSTRNKFLAK
jgi:hypothetical protein